LQEGWPATSLAPAPLPKPKQSRTHEEAGRKVVDAGAGVSKWQERNAVDASDAGASDLERGGLDTLEHFLSRPLQDFAFPEPAPLVSIPLPLPLTNSQVGVVFDCMRAAIRTRTRGSQQSLLACGAQPVSKISACNSLFQVLKC